MLNILRSPDIYTPKTIQEIDNILKKGLPVVPFAGGTYIMSRNGYYPNTKQKDFLNLSDVSELSRIQYTEKALEVGSMVTLNQLLLKGKFIFADDFTREISNIGNSIIQKKSTVGGALCIPDKRCTMSCILAVIGAFAEIRIIGKSGVVRWIPVEKLYNNDGKFLYGSNSIMTRIRIPSKEEGRYQIFRVVGSPMEDPDGCVIAGLQYSVERGTITTPKLCFAFPNGGFFLSQEVNSAISSVKLPCSAAEINRIASFTTDKVCENCNNVSILQGERVKRIMQTILYKINLIYLGE